MEKKRKLKLKRLLNSLSNRRLAVTTLLVLALASYFVIQRTLNNQLVDEKVNIALSIMQEAQASNIGIENWRKLDQTKVFSKEVITHRLSRFDEITVKLENRWNKRRIKKWEEEPVRYVQWLAEHPKSIENMTISE